MAKQTNFRTDSVLGKLPEEAQQALDRFIREVTEGDRYDAAVDHLALDGIKVSRSAVWSWHASWKVRQEVAGADSIVEEFQELMRLSEAGFTPEQIAATGQLLFTKLALANRDSDEYRQMEYLKLAKETAKTKASFEREKIEIRKQAEERATEKLKLEREKFIQLSCEKILDAAKDGKAREIAERNIPRAEQIAALRQEYFKDIDALEASGEIKLPE